jgi:hypothetical protein
MSRIVRGVFGASETLCRQHPILNIIGGTKEGLNLNLFRRTRELGAKICISWSLIGFDLTELAVTGDRRREMK